MTAAWPVSDGMAPGGRAQLHQSVATGSGQGYDTRATVRQDRRDGGTELHGWISYVLLNVIVYPPPR